MAVRRGKRGNDKNRRKVKNQRAKVKSGKRGKVV